MTDADGPAAEPRDEPGRGDAKVCEFTVTASCRSLPSVRERVRRWLAELDWPAAAAADIVLAVNEAVSNAMEHAYPPGAADLLIEFAATVELGAPAGLPGGDGTRRVRVSVRDHGRWRPDTHDRSDVARSRGRGLVVMDAVVAEMTITSSATTGTTVVLLSEPVADR